MRTFIGTIVSALILAPSLFAQVPTSGNIFIGYSYNRATATVDNATNLNGWNGSLEGKIFPFVGLVVRFQRLLRKRQRSSIMSGDHRRRPMSY